MMAVDGSEASELAYNIAIRGLFRPHKDCFNIITVTDGRKDYLPPQYRPAYIESTYQAKIYANAGSGNAKFVKKELELDMTAKETIWMMA